MPILHEYPYNEFKTNVPGLLFWPQFEQAYINEHDGTLSNEPYAQAEFSVCNQTVLFNLLQQVRPKTILEIGVHNIAETPHVKFGDFSCPSTIIIRDFKLPECIYLGADLRDKSFVNNPLQNMHTIQGSSADLTVVYERMQLLNMISIDLLLIDGHHSVNMAFNDWQYTQWLSPNGVVVLHDTNRHPGPMLLLDAVDPELYHKEKLCTAFEDNGISTFRRKHVNSTT